MASIPLTVADMSGLTTVGSQVYGDAVIHGSQITLAENSVVSSLSVYTDDSGTGNITIAIYNSTFFRQYLSSSQTQNFGGWTVFNDVDTYLPSGDYWLCAVAQIWNFRYDAVGTQIYMYTTGDVLEEQLFGVTLGDEVQISMYATFDVYVEPTPTPTPTASPTPSPTASPTVSPTQTVPTPTPIIYYYPSPPANSELNGLAVLSAFILLLNILFLVIKTRVGAIFGIVSMVFFVYTLGDSSIPAQPIFSLICIIVAFVQFGQSLTLKGEKDK